MLLDSRKAKVPLPQSVIDEACRAIEDHYPKKLWEAVKFQILCSPNVFDYEKPEKACWSKEKTDQHRRLKNARRWIEQFCRIQNKAGEIVEIKLNAAQRRFLSKVIRRWRKGEMARVVILKPRQTGFSTVVELLIFYLTVTSTYKRGEVIAHKRQISSKILNMFRRALNFIPFDLPTNHRTRYEVVFDDPLNCAVDVDSAESDEPGHGDTLQYLHLTEVSRWKNARNQAKGVMQTVPDLPGTLVVWESTANGAEGYFYELYNEAKDEDNPANRMDAVFVAWYEHSEYTSKPLSSEARAHVIKTLTPEEEDLLKRSFFVRGEGWRTVSMEQLVWRRNILVDKCGGSLEDFHEQYPATDMEAFLASGSPVFSPEKLIERQLDTRDPVWRGDLFDPEFTPKEVPDEPGSLSDVSHRSVGGSVVKHAKWESVTAFTPPAGEEDNANAIIEALGDPGEDQVEKPRDYDRDSEWS